jgi:hypothetical protein
MKRKILECEQPNQLLTGLNEAERLYTDLTEPSGVFARLGEIFIPSRTLVGVPGEVEDALVIAQGIRISYDVKTPVFFFCHSHSYLVDIRTLGKSKKRDYPDPFRSRMTVSCPIPRVNGDNYCAVMQVSIKQRVRVNFLRFARSLSELNCV